MKKKADANRPPPNEAAPLPYHPDFLYRAYRYRQRPNRSPREDFLTESLAELLNALSHIEHGRYAKGLLGIERMVDFGSGFRWSTQTALSGVGRPDLIGRGLSADGGGIYLIVENKVSAGYTGSGENDQLSRYGRYLEQREEPHKALVLITHWTPPSEKADVVVRWREIAGKLVTWKHQGSLAKHPIAETLSAWLVHFLKEENMSEIKLDLMDIASVASHRRLIDACEVLGEVIRPVADSLKGFFEDVGLKVLSASGWREFRTNKYGPPFYGHIWSPGEGVADTCVVVWAGVWTGQDIYNISPALSDQPELSFGIGLWADEWQAEQQVGPMNGLLTDLLADLESSNTTGWKIDKALETTDAYATVFIRKTRSFSACYEPGLDWEDMAKRFFEECSAELKNVSQPTLQAIVGWDEEDGEAEENEQ